MIFQSRKNLFVDFLLLLLAGVVAYFFFTIYPTEPDTANEAEIANQKELEPLKQPLSLDLQTEKEHFLEGEQMSLSFSASQDFHAVLVYAMADGTIVQLYPTLMPGSSKILKKHVEYTIPGTLQPALLEVAAPFGAEQLLLYGQEQPIELGDGRNVTPSGLAIFQGTLDDFEEDIRQHNPNIQKVVKLISTSKG